jgi:hypothetical protein
VVAPEFVVVEEVDAAVYSRGEDGRLLTRETAQALADSLAGGRRPGAAGPAVYRLTRVAPGRPPAAGPA